MGNMKEEERHSSKGLKKFMVTDICEKKKDHINPVIVTFQNGELNEQQASKCKVTLTPSTDGRTSVEIRTSYGHVFMDSDFKNNIQPTQVLAIRNKKTNKVKLVEVNSAVLINSALVTTSEKDTRTAQNDKDVKALNKTFGGKKIIARLMQREKLNLSLTPDANEVLKVIEDVTVEENTSVNETEIESITDLLPPCHRNVNDVSKVYVLNEILSEEELLALKNEANSLQESKADLKEYSEFYLQHLAEVKKSKENLENRAAGILFADCLIRFLKMPSRKIAAKNAVLCSFSSVIHNKLLNEFCIKTESSIARPMTMRDKCLCYIIAVSLICCNYKVNLRVLSLSTAVHFNRVTRLARVVGAVPLSKHDVIFTLKLPLPALPKSTKGRVRRK